MHNIYRMDPDNLIELFEQEGQIFIDADNANVQDDGNEDLTVDHDAVDETGAERRERLADAVMGL